MDSYASHWVFSPIKEERRYRIVSYATDKAISVRVAQSGEEAVQLDLETIRNGPTIRAGWRLVHGPDNCYYISMVNDFTLEVNDPTKPGDPLRPHVVVKENAKGEERQQWCLENAAERGYFYIVSKKLNMVLDVKEGSHANDVNIIGFRKHGLPNQMWRLVEDDI